MSRLLKIIGLLCKRALQKRLYSAKETYNFEEPTNRSHPPIGPGRVLLDLSIPIYTHTHIHIHTHMNIHIHTCAHTHIHVQQDGGSESCVARPLHECIHTHTHTHTQTLVHIHTHIHTYKHLHAHTHIHAQQDTVYGVATISRLLRIAGLF